MRKLVAQWFAAFVFLLGAACPAQAYVVQAYWSGGTFEYSVNVQTFVDRINGHSLTSTEARFWNQYAVSEWVSRSGIPIAADYLGDTTDDCGDHGGATRENTVEVEWGCAPGESSPCTTLATTTSTWSGGTLLEADMCVWGGSANWELQLANIATTEVDLVGLLVHEYGHMLGLGDVNGVPAGTMDGGYLGGGLNRYLFGDDIEGLRDAYDSITIQGLASYWREFDDYWDTWSSSRSMGGSQSFQPRRADIGSDSSGNDYVVAAAADHDGDYVHFKRAAYPLGTSATWTNYAFAYDSWVTPAITSNHDPTSGTFVAAWPEPTDTEASCGAMRFLKTTGAFASGNTTATESDFCTLVAPAIEWVDGTGRDYYLLVWLDFDFSTEENTGEILYATSSSGTSWSSATRTGIYALDTPGVACEESGDCQLTYVRASLDQSQLVNRAITMSTGGAMTLGSYTTKSIYLQRESDIVWADGNGTWMGIYHYTTDYDWLSKGYGSFYTYYNVTNPMPTAGYSSVGESSEHPGTLAGNIGFEETYLFFVD